MGNENIAESIARVLAQIMTDRYGVKVTVRIK